MSENLEKIEAIKKRVVHGKLKFQKKKIKDQLLKDSKPRDREREDICRKAREKAHTIVADVKRNMSNEIRTNLHTLSEGYDFIEESFGSGSPEFTFYEEPQESANISEAFEDGNKYGMIGVAEGVFAPIGVMSRNNRIYDEDHYDYLLENELLQNKITGRGMLGTIGHHDKKVDDEDLANGVVSHIVTDLHIQEEADGSRNLVGRLEIMDTPAGHLLKTYYDHGVPLYVSSRGAGRLLNVANESYKRVDKTNYFLETFDIVKDPGFLQAKPNYVKESLEETEKDFDNTIGENNMDNKKVVPAIDTKMEAEEIVNKLLTPLQEQLAALTETVKLLSEKVIDEAEVEETVEETEVVEESKAEETVSETEEVTEEIKEEVTEEVVEEVVEEAKEEETTEEVVEESCKKEEDDKEDKKEDKCEECDEAKAEETTEEVVEEAKAEEVTEEAETEETTEEVVTEEANVCAEPKKETEDDEDEKKAPVAESAEEYEEPVDDAEIVEEYFDDEEAEKCDEAKEEEADTKEEAEKPEAKEDEAEDKKEDEEENVDECACAEPKKETEDDEDEKKAPVAESEEAVDYQAKFEQSEAVINDLVEMVTKASERSKSLVEKYDSAMKELNAYKLAEELSITIDEAKEKLETKSYDEIKEEAEQAEIEAKAEPVVEEVVVESKKATKPVFSRFAGLNESKKSNRKGFSIFG